MQALLIKFANVTVMVHMALGCAWHHGLASHHACTAKSIPVTACCEHHSSPCEDGEGDSDDHDGHRQIPSGDSLATESGCDGHHPHDHSTCQSDRCAFYKTSSSDSEQIIVLVKYLNGICSDSIVVRSDAWPQKQSGLLSSGATAPLCLRAHLYLCVLII